MAPRSDLLISGRTLADPAPRLHARRDAASSRGRVAAVAEPLGELVDLRWASVPRALETIERHRDLILGIKVRLTRGEIVGEGAGLQPLFLAREAADAAGLSIMVHPQEAWTDSLDEVLAV